MNKYRVYGTTTVTVSLEVEAKTEEEALELAEEKIDCLTSYAGNGGLGRIVGVDGDYESEVDSGGSIEYDTAELLEIDSNDIIENVTDIAENLDWTVDLVKDDNWVEITFGKYSPKGEDFHFTISCETPEEIAKEVTTYGNDLDPEEHAAMWYCNKDRVGGVPQSLEDLLYDAKSIVDMIV